MKHRTRKPAKMAAVLLTSAIALPAHSAVSMLPPTYTGVASDHIILAQTDGMEWRDERRDDLQDDRQAEGAGGDKRDCKQDERQDRNGDS